MKERFKKINSRFKKRKTEKRKNKNIKKQLTFYFLLLSIIPILVIGIVNYQFQKIDIRKNLKAVNIQIVHSISDQVQNYLFDAASSVESMNKMYDFSKMNPMKAQVILDSTARDYSNLKQIDIYDLEGNFLISSEKDRENSTIDDATVFDRIKDGKRYVSGTYQEENIPIAILYTP